LKEKDHETVQLVKNHPNAVPQDPFRLGFVLHEEPQSDRLRPIFLMELIRQAS
jgi:hypothetical protein